MLSDGINTTVIDAFNGSITRLDPYAVDQSHGLYAQNCGYLHGQVGKRYGHTAMFTLTDGAVTAMYNWFFVFGSVDVSVIAYYAPSVGVRTLNQIGVTVQTVMAVTGAAGAIMVASGERLYAAFYGPTGRIGFAAGEVYGWNLGADVLFAAPMTSTVTCAETTSGVCNAGTRRIGFLPTTRNGFTTKLSPAPSDLFTPVSFTSTGGHNIAVTITGTLPAYMVGGTVQIVMTTVANLNRYFTVPLATASAANPNVINVSISDDDLTATGTDVTDQMDLLTTSVFGTPPFLPSAIFAYSNRMGYVTMDASGAPVIFMSEQNDYQHITADQHGIYLSAQAQPVQGFELRGVCYVGATDGFYSTEDNGDLPVTWTPPQKVDGSIGILSPTCLFVNPAQGYALVASQHGFYIFQGGTFPALALSYYQQSDWGRINWNVSTRVQVADDQVNKRLIVAAPLNINVLNATNANPIRIITDGAHLYQNGLTVTISGVGGNTNANGTFVISQATIDGVSFTIPIAGNGTYTSGGLVQPQAATHEMTWDYTEGDTPETAKYSLNAFTAYRAGCLAIILNSANLLKEVWYAPNANGAIIRQNDGSETLPYHDPDLSGTPTAINWLYETAQVPGPEAEANTVSDFHGAHIKGNGVGGLTMKVFGLDHAVNKVPARSPLTLTSGQEQLVKWSLRSEQQSFQFGNNAIDEYMIISLLRMYSTPAMAQR